MKILIVDDDHEIAELLEIYVKNEGYEPVIASDGREAMTKIRTNPDIGLIILDIMISQMVLVNHGHSVLKKAHQQYVLVSHFKERHYLNYGKIIRNFLVILEKSFQ